MRKKSAPHAYGLAIFVGALIVLLILAALLIKLFLLFQQTTFTGKHQFILRIHEPQQNRFITFNPEDQSIHSLLLHGSFSGNPLLTLGIPVDATLTSEVDISSVSTLANTLLFERKNLDASSTIVDGVNLFLFIHTANQDLSIVKELTTSTDTATLDAVLSKIFIDESMYKEGQSVAIVNGTGVAGLGNKVSRLLRHIGANVVSVTTADTPSPKSSITYVQHSTYTLTRLSRILGLPMQRLSTSAVSDITILLGTDKKGWN